MWHYYKHFSYHEKHENISHDPEGTYIMHEDHMELVGICTPQRKDRHDAGIITHIFRNHRCN
jgi:hypothetical protein